LRGFIVEHPPWRNANGGGRPTSEATKAREAGQ
jgi:hypothetical protein